MTYFYACTGCAVDRATCEPRRAIKQALVGLRIGSIRHTCAARVPTYTPGCAVEVETVPWLVNKGWEEEDTSIKGWYRGVFIEQVGSKALAFIKPGQIPADGDDELLFEGSGIVKVPLSRVRQVPGGEAADVTPCRNCGAMTKIGQNCGQPSQPEYGFQSGLCQKRIAESQP